jgi:hypothetical protein
MAYPPAYTRSFSFTDYETNFPGQPKPGDELDTEYDNVSNALTATQANLALIQRADGELANNSVGVDQLQDDVFDGIVDGITDDAQAAADAAASSASAAAASASAASTSAASAAIADANAAGAAAQAGVSQGIAQGAAVAAGNSADEAADSATAAANSANQAQGFRNEAGMHEELAFDWAEKLEGPVMPAPPGWPEAVDDGMFSSKWWAIRAREYNSTEVIDLGTAGTDIGDAFDIWDAIPGNDIGVGQVYATWGTPAHTYVLIDRSNPSDPNSWEDITGGPGPPNVLTVGTTTTLPAGSPATVTITGTSPAQVIDFGIPEGPQGIQGIQGIPGPAGTPTFANPSALVGLTAVNGVSTDSMRADAAPALDQGIVPTWTGVHTFARAGGQTAQFVGTTGRVVDFNSTAATGPYTTFLRSGVAFGDIGDGGAMGAGFTLDALALVARAGNPLQLAANGSASPQWQINTAGNIVQTGVLYGPNGSQSLPTFGFTNDIDSGVYLAATGDVRITTGGTAKIRVVDGSAMTVRMITGQFGLQDGTAAAPALSFEADPDTGLFRAAADNMRLAAGGASVCGFANAGGTILIQPFGALQAIPDGTAASPIYSFNNDPGTGMYRYSAGAVGFATSGAYRALFTAAYFDFTGVAQAFGNNGTAGVPTYSFAGDPDTGLYLWTVNGMAFTTGGVARFYVGSSWLQGAVPFLAYSGSAALPGIAFDSDQDTGFFRPASDTLDIVIGAGTRVRITAAQFASNIDVAAPSFITTSARATKRETGALSGARDILSRLRPILYRLLAGDDREQLGLIAEEVRDVCPQLSDGKTVAYDRLAILLLAAWQDDHAVAA